jgi:hypothetical protein
MQMGEAPYRLWRADLWACPGCDAQVVAGFSDNGFLLIAEHYQREFQAELETIKAQRFVYDHERPGLGKKKD